MAKYKKHKRKSRKMPKAKLWEWIVSILLTGTGTAVIWSNESIDLLSKFGFNLSPGLNFIIFGLTFMTGLSWIVTIYLRHLRLI